MKSILLRGRLGNDRDVRGFRPVGRAFGVITGNVGTGKTVDARASLGRLTDALIL
jgi:hypothetical protein